MEISRRHVLRAIPAVAGIGSTVLSQQVILAQDVATPAETPVVDPAVLLGRLQAAEVQTPLFPADTGMVRARPWSDDNDTDLVGAVGGVIMQTAQAEAGVYIVYPFAAAARG